MVKNTIHFNSEGMVKMSSHIYDVNIDLSCLLSLYIYLYMRNSHYFVTRKSGGKKTIALLRGLKNKGN